MITEPVDVKLTDREPAVVEKKSELDPLVSVVLVLVPT